MRPNWAQIKSRFGSVRTRLMLWNICALAIILSFLGAVIQYTIRTNMLSAVDRQLAAIPLPRAPGPPMPFPMGFFWNFPDRIRDMQPRHDQQPGQDNNQPGNNQIGRDSHPARRDINRPGKGQQLYNSQRPHDPDNRQGSNQMGRDSRPARTDNTRPGKGQQVPNNQPPPAADNRPGNGPQGGTNLPPGNGRNRPDDNRNSLSPRMLPVPEQPFDGWPRHIPFDVKAYRLTALGTARYSTVKVEGATLRVYSRPVRGENRVIAVSQVAYPLDGINQAIKVVDRTLLMLIPVALILAGFGGTLITSKALRPVRGLADAADEIGAQELSRRLPYSGDDEFSQLAKTFNQMLGRLEIAFAQRGAMVKELEEMIARERRFTADASHELKTPLTIVKANASLMLQDAKSYPELHEALLDVDQAANTMSRLVQDLLLLACYDTGKNDQEQIPLPVGEVLNRVSRRNGISNRARVSVEPIDPSLMFYGNEHEICRVFSNLLDNALRYTPPDGAISICAERDGEDIVVNVADTGIGVAPEHLAHLGERFYRVDYSRSRPDGGTGLGLSICKSILKAHGGGLTIKSQPGKGTTITVRLPAYQG